MTDSHQHAERYSGSISVSFFNMPLIELQPYRAGKKAGVIERLAIATKRRKFTLKTDWELDLGDIEYGHDLNGTVVIPSHNETGEANVFDGATIPVPWLVSLLTIGILRPLGVMLIGSIVHDYAYARGGLMIRADADSKARFVTVKRHHADKVFRDIIGTVNGLPLVGYIAWLAVRVGWLWVPYNHQRYTGRKPASEYLFVALLVSGTWLLGQGVGFQNLFLMFLVAYLAFYVVSLFVRQRYRYNDTIA